MWAADRRHDYEVMRLGLNALGSIHSVITANHENNISWQGRSTNPWYPLAHVASIPIGCDIGRPLGEVDGFRGPIGFDPGRTDRSVVFATTG